MREIHARRKQQQTRKRETFQRTDHGYLLLNMAQKQNLTTSTQLFTLWKMLINLF